MRRFLILPLCFAALVSLVACSSDDDEGSSSDDSAPSVEQTTTTAFEVAAEDEAACAIIAEEPQLFAGNPQDGPDDAEDLVLLEDAAAVAPEDAAAAITSLADALRPVIEAHTDPAASPDAIAASLAGIQGPQFLAAAEEAGAYAQEACGFDEVNLPSEEEESLTAAGDDEDAAVPSGLVREFLDEHDPTLSEAVVEIEGVSASTSAQDLYLVLEAPVDAAQALAVCELAAELLYGELDQGRIGIEVAGTDQTVYASVGNDTHDCQ
jgi:hypothetical protein